MKKNNKNTSEKIAKAIKLFFRVLWLVVGIVLIVVFVGAIADLISTIKGDFSYIFGWL